MKCEACGGDGQIEVGAYRGDEDDSTTRPCQLCGGVVTGTVGAELDRLAQNAGRDNFAAMVDAKAVTPSSAVLSKLGQSALEASAVIRDLVMASTASVSGATMTQNAHGFYESDEPVPLPMRDKTVEAREIKFERTVSARNADDEMNKFLRDNFKD